MAGSAFENHPVLAFRAPSYPIAVDLKVFYAINNPNCHHSPLS